MNLFEINSATFLTLGAIMVAMWVAQFALAHRQMKQFYRRLKIVRKDGRTAVGMSGNRYRGRVYGVLVIDADGQITHAEGMQGWTVLARLRPVPEVVGLTLDQLTEESAALPVSDQLKSALLNAADYLRRAPEEMPAAAHVTPA